MSHMWHDWLEAPSPLISTSSNTTPSILLSANPSQSRAESSTRIDTFFTVIRRNSGVALAFVGGAPFSWFNVSSTPDFVQPRRFS